jgi:hypothetical protein
LRAGDFLDLAYKHQLDGVNLFNETGSPTMDEFMIDAAVGMHAAFKTLVRKLSCS